MKQGAHVKRYEPICIDPELLYLRREPLSSASWRPFYIQSSIGLKGFPPGIKTRKTAGETGAVHAMRCFGGNVFFYHHNFFPSFIFAWLLSTMCFWLRSGWGANVCCFDFGWWRRESWMTCLQHWWIPSRHTTSFWRHIMVDFESRRQITKKWLKYNVRLATRIKRKLITSYGRRKMVMTMITKM